MTSPRNYGNHWLLSMIFSLPRGYLHTKFEVFSISQSCPRAKGYKSPKKPGYNRVKWIFNTSNRPLH